MADAVEALERRIDELRAAVRRAVASGDRDRARTLRGELRRAEQQWDEALDDLAAKTDHTARTEPAQAGRTAQAERAGLSRGRGAGAPPPLLPLREQVHQALTLLGTPAAPKLIIAVHRAFAAGEMLPARLTSLRRDEERSFRSAPHARPYHLCAALTADLLAPARGLLAVSTWPAPRRIIGPLSPRVDFLSSAIRLAEHVARLSDPPPAAVRLLWRYAANIPGATGTAGGPSALTEVPAALAPAARAELAVHADADAAQRTAAARRAAERLDPAEQLFGNRLRIVTATGT